MPLVHAGTLLDDVLPGINLTVHCLGAVILDIYNVPLLVTRIGHSHSRCLILRSILLQQSVRHGRYLEGDERSLSRLEKNGITVTMLIPLEYHIVSAPADRLIKIYSCYCVISVICDIADDVYSPTLLIRGVRARKRWQVCFFCIRILGGIKRLGAVECCIFPKIQAINIARICRGSMIYADRAPYAKRYDQSQHYDVIYYRTAGPFQGY